MSRIEELLTKHMKDRVRGNGAYSYILIEAFDHDADNEVTINQSKKLKPGDTFSIQDTTYEVKEAEWYSSEEKGKALVKMVRYKIPDTATQFVHKCPVRRMEGEALTKDDILKFKKEFGKVKGNKKVSYIKQGRVKMQSYNKLEIKCPLCDCIFYKTHNSLPESVIVNKIMKKKRLKK